MKRSRRTLAVAVLAAAAASMPGCYKRVVRSSGYGAINTPTYKPNLKTGEERSSLDKFGDLIFGPVEVERER